MKDKLSSILNIMLILLIVVSAVLLLVFYYGTSLYNSDAEFAEQIGVLGWRLDAFLNWAIILIFVGALAAFVFPIINMITNPASSKKGFISIGVVIVVLIAAYLLSSDEIVKFNGYEKFFYENNSMDANSFSKYVGTGLWTMYIFGVLSVVAILYAEIAKFFK